MKRDVFEIVKDKNLDEITAFPHCRPEMVEETIFPLMAEFYTEFGKELIVYGGLTATPQVYGFKKLRSVTNDIDFLCSPQGLRAVLESKPVVYMKTYDVLYMSINQIPITFSCGHIHDWVVVDEIFATARVLNCDKGAIFCIGPEYSIFLKLLRSLECVHHERKIFGKDAADIINILISSRLEPAPLTFDVDFFISLIISHKELTVYVKAIFNYIAHYKGHLPKRHWPAFEDVFNMIYGKLPGGRL